MSNPPTSQKHVDALKQFYKNVGVDLAKAKQANKTAETPQRHYVDTLVSADKWRKAQQSYENVRKTFGESLDLKVGDEQWPTRYIEVNRGVVQKDDSASIPQNGGELRFGITIHKSALIKKLKLAESRSRFFYLFEKDLVNFLSAPVLKLDDLLFREPCPQTDNLNQTSKSDKPVLIVLSETEVHFAGEMLTIVDELTLAKDDGLRAALEGQQPGKTTQTGTSPTVKGDQEKAQSLRDYVRSVLKLFSNKPATPQQARSPLATLSGTLQEEIQKYRTAAIETPSLIGGQFEHLTPLHFLGQWRIKHDALEKILGIHFLNICILCTANRSVFDHSKQALTSVYESADRTTTLNLKEAPTANEIPISALEELSKWLYGGKGTDRRHIFQNIVARSLADDNPKINYDGFIARAPQLLKEAMWQHQVFIDGKITEHFDELQKVIGYVADINKKISEAIDSVTKSLTDALLATIGVLVLTVLAALVKKETSIEIFSLSMEIYAVYLFVYVVFRMGSIGHSYILLSKEASGQVGEYQSALQIEQITDLSSSLRKRQWQFHIWFWLTVVLYVGLGGLVWWTGERGPRLLIERGIITAPAAKTPEATSSGGNNSGVVAH
jgi:hypothetical protein